MSERPTNWRSIRHERARRDDYTCGNCGRRRDDPGVEQLHVHHIVPRSKGGTDKQDNLKTLCKRCHNSIHHDEKMAPTHVSVREPGRATDPAPEWEPENIDGQVGLMTLVYLGGMSAIVYVGYSLGGWGVLLLCGLVGIPAMFLVSAFIGEKVYPPEPKHPK